MVEAQRVWNAVQSERNAVHRIYAIGNSVDTEIILAEVQVFRIPISFENNLCAGQAQCAGKADPRFVEPWDLS
jgi:hypothetical protein